MPGGLYLQVLTGTMGVDRPVDSTQLWYPAPVPVPVRVPGVNKIMIPGVHIKLRFLEYTRLGFLEYTRIGYLEYIKDYGFWSIQD